MPAISQALKISEEYKGYTSSLFPRRTELNVSALWARLVLPLGCSLRLNFLSPLYLSSEVSLFFKIQLRSLPRKLAPPSLISYSILDNFCYFFLYVKENTDPGVGKLCPGGQLWPIACFCKCRLPRLLVIASGCFPFITAQLSSPSGDVKGLQNQTYLLSGP